MRDKGVWRASPVIFPSTSQAEMGSYVHSTSSLHKQLTTVFQQQLYVISVSDIDIDK